MGGNYYDVVVLGMDPGPLCAGALLSRRGFRVLVIGHHNARESYHCHGYRFVKRPFLLPGASSPVISKIIQELSVGQLFSHTELPCDVKFQVVQPSSRISVFEDAKQTAAELVREFPEYAYKITDIMTEVGRYSGDFEKFIQNDLVIPPETFFERRDFSRSAVQNPFMGMPTIDVFEKLGVRGKFRDFLEILPRFFGGGLAHLSPLVTARIIGAWLFDTRCLKDGLDGLRHLLCERIIEQGGDIQESYCADGIEVKRGKVTGVRMSGRKETTATQMVLTDLRPSSLSSLVEPQAWTSRFKALVEDDPDPLFGYALNLGVKKEVLPAGMADTVFLAMSAELGADLLRIQVVPQDDPDRAGLNISCAVPNSNEDILSGRLRDKILDRMRWLIPYLDNYLEVIHSPFDGFGPVDLTGEADPAAPSVPHPEQIENWLIRVVQSPGEVGIENVPHRTGIKGLLLSGSQVVSGLGVETDFIAAWGVAKIAGKMDPSRQRIARSMRSKVEV
ncbi:MAG: hypothetical protein JXX29_06920 [Deltaproteobacteria bacterium]|nr:hypothetical protein [Deltaproteobacteria bacterium]MBN2671385.1 hypothetical protein [Deltaproteobacteria bacterium]